VEVHDFTERTGPVFPDGFNVETASPKDYFDLIAMFAYNINHTVFFIHKTKNIPISNVILVFLDCPMIFLS
jgi:hypothetical protein